MKNHIIMTILTTILSTAVMAQQTPQQIADLQEQYHETLTNRDNGFSEVYKSIQQQIASQQKYPVNCAVWHNYMATLLIYYWDEYGFKILDRTAIEGQVPENPEVWDARTLMAQIIFHFQKSLEQPELLASIPIRQFRPIISQEISSQYRPTLFDFLAFRAIDHLEDCQDIPVPTEPFNCHNELFWADNETFARLAITSPDSLSTDFHILRILQSLTKAHLKDRATTALLDVTHLRYVFLKEHSDIDNSNETYLQQLNLLEKQYHAQPGEEIVTFALGEYYVERGDEYDVNLHPEYKDDYLEAIRWFEQTISISPTSIEGKNAQEYIDFLKASSIRISCTPKASAGQSLSIFTTQNCKTLQFRIIPLTTSEKERFSSLYEDKAEYAFILGKKHVFEQSIEIPDNMDCQEKSSYFLLPELNPGFYLLAATNEDFTAQNKGVFTVKLLQIANIASFERNADSDDCHNVEYFIYDRSTGHPIGNADIEIGLYAHRSLKECLSRRSLKTRSDGNFELSHINQTTFVKIDATHGKETYEVAAKFLYPNHYKSDTFSIHTDYLFTDRNIYRPGQTIYFKGISIKATEYGGTTLDQQVMAGMTNIVRLMDANDQVINTAELVTNEYGSFSGSFKLPTSGLTGNFKIRSNYGSYFISVEEYKRPTFEITVEQPKASFKVGDIVMVEGNARAYAGYAIDGATVRYNVRRVSSFPWWRNWWWQPESNSQQIADGEVKTDADGIFRIEFTAKPDLSASRFSPLYNYEIIIDVTDLNGETHRATANVMVSDIKLQIHCDIPNILASNCKQPLKVEVTNLSNEPQAANVHYAIALLTTPEHYLTECPHADCYLSDSATLQKRFPYLDFNRKRHPDSWAVEKTIAEGELVTKGPTAIPLSNLDRMTEGKYRISFTTRDDNGNEISEVQHFTLYHPESKKCVVYQPLWLETNADGPFAPGDTLRGSIGTYLQNAYVTYEIYANNHLLTARSVVMNREKTDFTIPLSADELGNIIIFAYTAQNNMLHTNKYECTVENPAEKIDFDFITFRDKTLPGSEEQYLIRLKNHKGNKVNAELLCSMYDASLDALSSPVNLNKTINKWNRGYWQSGFSGIERLYFSSSGSKSFGKTIYSPGNLYRIYPEWLNPPSFYLTKFSTIGLRTVGTESVAYDFAFSSMADVAEVVEESKSNTAPLKSAGGKGPAEKTPAPEQPNNVRTNFSETAFFYPHLQTDEEGNILIAFKMPESLTRWRLQGFAHNADLMSGHFNKFVQTSKKLMVVPNAPRFLREGDTLLFSAKIVNTDSTTQCGNVRLSLRNALDNSPLSLIDGNNILPFEVQANESFEVHFRIHVPADVPAVTYRIEATNLETPAFTDGEEATLPVLTNRILVTESMPLHISGAGQKTFTFDRLKRSFTQPSSTLSTQSLTMEFTPNPIWYAIQAMPYLMEYPYECNEQVFSRYYANTLAANIVKSHPRIQEVFTQWQNETPDAFCSQLEKNEELKNVLLEETPWVMDAQNEATRKQNIALLFDLQRMANEQNNAVQKLTMRQNSDGGWSWFVDGESSTYITEHIVAGIGHLKTLNVPTTFTTNVKTLNNALQFIDNKMNENYQKHQKKYPTSGYGDIHYLYARSYFLYKAVPASCRAAYNFNYDNIKANWRTTSIYMQGMIALICYRNGDRTLAKQIIDNIKSRAQHDEEMGMYWALHGDACYWQNAPIERQALLIEAFNTITHDSKSVEEMQLWLLKQKQTQSWPTTKSTSEAIYALLLNNDQLDNCEGVQLSVGSWHYTEGEPGQDAEAGTGYIKQSWTGEQVTADKSSIHISKETAGPAWGGLYWQYLENVDKVEHSQDGKFGIRKQLFRVAKDDRGEVLTPITEQTPLHVGDRVRVRVEIRTDRAMEYVHLKDMRAACFEPTNVLSGYKHQDGLWYYESTRDAATNFFIDYLPKGTYVFEYTLTATMAGDYSNGLTSIQCMYAPEFSSHSEGIRVVVK